MSKILVTGGAGYLGSHLARKLLGRGETVRIFDLRRTKYVPDGAELIEGDMRDRAAVERAVEGCRTVYHLAFVQSLSKLPEEERREINFGGTRNFLEAASAADVERFVHTSTIEIYGVEPPYPCPEDAPTDEPVGWYGEHKLGCEGIVREVGEQTGLSWSMVRMPTICGPGFYNHRPILKMVDWIAASRPIVVSGGEPIQGDFVHFEDVLQGYLLCGTEEAASGEAFNLSCGRSASHEQIALAIRDAVGSSSRVIRIPRFLYRLGIKLGARLFGLPGYQVGYMLHHNVYSVEKARRLLGYEPRYSAAEAAAELAKGYLQDREFVKARSESY